MADSTQIWRKFRGSGHVEAAHFKNVVHRDLKPENILCDSNTKTLAIADFGIARFAEELLATLVETSPAQRLANFTYAAPEQRVPGQAVTISADIYALGLIMNEMFTGVVPLGTGYPSIESVSKELGFLDPVVARMISQAPAARPASISEVKALIQRHQSEAVSLQRLSAITNTVIKADAIEDPLAHEPPKVISGDWNNGRLTLKLDRPVTSEWVNAFHNIGNYTSVMGIPPTAFSFRNSDAMVGVDTGSAQQVIDFFKVWLPKATQELKRSLTENARRAEAQRLEKLRQEQRAEEERLKANRGLRF